MSDMTGKIIVADYRRHRDAKFMIVKDAVGSRGRYWATRQWIKSKQKFSGNVYSIAVERFTNVREVTE